MGIDSYFLIKFFKGDRLKVYSPKELVGLRNESKKS